MERLKNIRDILLKESADDPEIKDKMSYANGILDMYNETKKLLEKELEKEMGQIYGNKV
jgi:hypothetical protein